MRHVHCTINVPAGTVLYAAIRSDGNVHVPVSATVPENGRADLAVDPCIPTGGADLTIIAPGMAPWQGRLVLPLVADEEGPLLELSPGANPFRERVVPTPRAPLTLPTCVSCPSPYSYDKVLPAPPQASRDWLRADAWTMQVPGLTPIGTGPAWAFTYLFDLWGPEDQQRLLDATNGRGYTHLYLSWPDSGGRAGTSIGQFIGSMRRVKANGLYVHVKVGSKDFDPRDLTLAQWQAYLGPALDAILSSGACDEVSFWEYDSFNQGGATSIDVHRWIGQLAHQAGVSAWAHFYPGHTFWADSFSQFWDSLGGDLDGLDYQGDPNWDVGLLQSRIVDVLTRFAAHGNQHKLRAFELCAAKQFADGRQDEDASNVLGYLACCTKGPAIVSGFGNGGRGLDGSVL